MLRIKFALSSLTTPPLLDILTNMKSRLLFNRRAPVTEQAFAELVLWEIRQPLPGCTHCYKYRLAFVVAGVCVLRYDNEIGKGDHRHSGEVETGYDFVSPGRLVADFFEDVRRWRDEHSND
jgi:hypothetical protein